MIKYAILQNPGHNRVYFDAAKRLGLVELEVASRNLHSKISELTVEEISGVGYFTFTSDQELNPQDLIILSRLSFAYAIFKIEVTDEKLYFIPIDKTCSYFFSDDLSMILKYSGKTNELFTRFMLNIATNIYLEDNPTDESLNIFDPLCGKGTSLFESLIMGHNAYGVDIDKKSIHESHIYFKKYLETGKYKHNLHKERISGRDKSFQAERLTFEVAKNKEDVKSGKSLKLELVDSNSKFTDQIFKRESFDIIIGDLPYGVQHGSKSAANSSFTRNPSEFVDQCLPAWFKVLKKNGIIILACNNFVLSTKNLESILKKHSLSCVTLGNPHCFEHRVDQAINRDVIIAKKI